MMMKWFYRNVCLSIVLAGNAVLNAQEKTQKPSYQAGQTTTHFTIKQQYYCVGDEKDYQMTQAMLPDQTFYKVYDQDFLFVE